MRYNLFFGDGANPRQKVEEISATAQAPLGAYFDDDDGNRFRYCLNASGALVAGDIIQSAALGGAATTLQTVGIIGANAAAGDTRIYVAANTTLQPAGTFNEGWAGFKNTSLTAAYIRRIKYNSEIEHTTWVDAYIDLYEALPVALVAASDTVALMANPYYKIIQAVNSAPTGAVLGGVRCAVTASYYCWIQTRGWFATHIKDGALAAGPVQVGPTTVGTLMAVAETTFAQHVGISNAAWADEAAGLVFLMCE